MWLNSWNFHGFTYYVFNEYISVVVSDMYFSIVTKDMKLVFMKCWLNFDLLLFSFDF